MLSLEPVSVELVSRLFHLGLLFYICMIGVELPILPADMIIGAFEAWISPLGKPKFPHSNPLACSETRDELNQMKMLNKLSGRTKFFAKEAIKYP